MNELLAQVKASCEAVGGPAVPTWWVLKQELLMIGPNDLDPAFIATTMDQMVEWGVSQRYEYGDVYVHTGLAGLFDRFVVSVGNVPFLAPLKMGDVIMDMGMSQYRAEGLNPTTEFLEFDKVME